MAVSEIRFDDGASYERYMGVWSRLVGETFLSWLAPSPGLRWIDIGCGNGAFTEQIVERCAPAEVRGVDPSEAQLVFARSRPGARLAEFRQGDAMALPFPNGSFEAAVMALVIFFVPDPAKGVAEMARVVHAGGMVATYAWDILGGGFPLEPVQAEMRGMGLTPCCRRASARPGWMRCGRYGPARASRRSRRERSPCSGRSQISTTSGRSSFCRQACAR